MAAVAVKDEPEGMQRAGPDGHDERNPVLVGDVIEVQLMAGVMVVEVPEHLLRLPSCVRVDEGPA